MKFIRAVNASIFWAEIKMSMWQNENRASILDSGTKVQSHSHTRTKNIKFSCVTLAYEIKLVLDTPGHDFARA